MGKQTRGLRPIARGIVALVVALAMVMSSLPPLGPATRALLGPATALAETQYDVTFAANGKTETRTVTLPHTFECDFQNGEEEPLELDSIIKALYGGSYCTEDKAPSVTSGGEGKVTAGLGWLGDFVTINAAFAGTATVQGFYTGYDYEEFPYSLDITVAESGASVDSVTLDPSTTSIYVDGAVALTATVSPDDATDKTVVWRVDGDAVKLYTDESCENEVGSDATDVLTVWAKGVTAGTATVTCTSNADGTKSASCDVTVVKLVAEVDGTGYADFSDAVAAWNGAADGSTLKLLADVQTTSTINVSNTNKKVLDLNGHGIANNRTCPVITVVGGDLTLNDSDEGKNHRFTFENNGGTGAGLATVDDSLESGYSVFSGGYITGGLGGYDGNWSYGGGIWLRGGAVTMNAGNIIGNLAQIDGGWGEGAAVAMHNGATFTMNGGSVMYNASLGGDQGAFHVNNSNLYVNGGTIAHNYCRGVSAGDVCVWHTGGFGGGNGTLYLSGSPLISGNIGETGNVGTETRQNVPNTVYVASDHIKEIRVTGPLTPPEPIGLTFRPDRAPRVFTASDDVQYNETEDFICEIPGYAVGKNAEGQLFLDSSVTVTFDANGHGKAPEAQTVASGSLVAKPDGLGVRRLVQGRCLHQRLEF